MPTKDAPKKLTKRVIDAAEPGAKEYCIWDSELKGFRLRVRSSGRKTFELRYRVGRRQRLLLLGDYGPLSPDQGRKAALDAKHAVSKGGDPQHEKQVLRHATTVGELIDLYLTEGRIDKPTKRESSWKTDATDLRCHVTPLIGKCTLPSLTTHDIARWQNEVIRGKTARTTKLGYRRKAIIKGGPSVVGRSTRTLNAVFNWAVKREIIKDNPVARAPRFPDKQRERFLTDEEAVALFQTLADMVEAHEMPGAYADLFRLLALTGARLAEIRDLAWAEVDFTRKMIVLSPERHKSGRTGRRKTINLNAPALAILKSRKNETAWVFPKTPPYQGPIETPRKFWKALVERANCPDLRLHDLRHTFASLLIKDGHSLTFVQKALGHSRLEVTQRYAHLNDEATRAAFDHIGVVYGSLTPAANGAVSRPPTPTANTAEAPARATLSRTPSIQVPCASVTPKIAGQLDMFD